MPLDAAGQNGSEPMSSIAGVPGPASLYAEQNVASDPAIATTRAGVRAQDVVPTPAPILIPISFGLSAFGVLGTSQPRSPEDTAALLAAITLALEETARTTRENRIVGRNEAMRGDVGQKLGALETVQALAEAIGAMRQDLEARKTEQAGKIEQRTQAQQQSASLATKIGALDGSIAKLDQQIAAAQAEGRPTSALVAERAALVSERDELTKQKGKADASVQTLTGEIATLATKINDLTVNIAASTAQFNALQAVLLFVFLQAALTLQVTEGQDDTLTRAASQNVTVTLDGVTERLREFAEDAQVQALIAEIRQEGRLRQEGEERIAVTALALTTAIADVLATIASLDLPLDSPLGNAAAQSRGRVRVAV